ncbi:MAG: ParB/RepB/Spo0J family partition protein [Thermoanaerobacterales bacterium]|nr:ParB/RepB/Spo0J family partition protein [Thermoanaerobacterales bacterium]
MTGLAEPRSVRFEELSVDVISPNPNNPRRKFDEDALAELAATIRQVGLIQPVVVTPDDTGRYRLVAGERRWRAARLAGWTTIPAIVRMFSSEEEAQAALIENLQRRDLDPLEEAQAFKKLIQDHGWTQDRLGEKLGFSQAHIANRIRLLDLPDDVREHISTGRLTAAHGRALLFIKAAPKFVREMADEAIRQSWSVRQLDEWIRGALYFGRRRFSRQLFKDGWGGDQGAEFDTSACRGCDAMVEASYHDDKKRPYCIRPSCWEKKQAEAKKQQRLEQSEKAKSVAAGGGMKHIRDLPTDSYRRLNPPPADVELNKCRECEKRLTVLDYGDEAVDVCLDPGCIEEQQAAAARNRAAATRAKTEKEVQTLSDAAAAIGGDMTECNDLIAAARTVWDTVERPTWFDLATPLLEKESLLPIDLLLRYFATKNDVCKDATNMPPQLGNVRILIPDQGIEFRGSEETMGSQKYPALTVAEGEGALTLQHDHGSVKDVVPTMPVFYKVQVRQSGGQRYLRQLVAIKTASRTIFVVGHAGTTMRKEIWARWQRLIEALPPAEAGPSPELSATPGEAAVEARAYKLPDGQVVFVHAGLGESGYGTFFRSLRGGLRRVKSPQMPMVPSREVAQQNLDAWAMEHNLPPAEAPADVISREMTRAQ